MGTDNAASNSFHTRSSSPASSAFPIAAFRTITSARPASKGNACAITTLERSLVVDRRLHLFAFVPTIFFWAFCSPFSKGWLAVLAGSRVLRDGFGIWLTSKTGSGSLKQAHAFDVFSIVITSCYLLISIAAWLYSEQLADPSTLSWEILLDAAHTAYANPWEWSLDGFLHMTEAETSPFFLTFVFTELLLLANRYSPLRG